MLGWVYLVMSSCVPVGDPGGIYYALLQAVGAESTEGDGGCAVDAADCPEWDGHCCVSR